MDDGYLIRFHVDIAFSELDYAEFERMRKHLQDFARGVLVELEGGKVVAVPGLPAVGSHRHHSYYDENQDEITITCGACDSEMAYDGVSIERVIEV